VGEGLLRDGKVGVILVAGGQGSRLGFDGPKGAYPVGPITDATLFEIHARKILNLETRFGAEIPFYVMTSDVNDGPTRAFFEEHSYFGLSRDRVKFFVQGMWPVLTGDGLLVLDRPDHLFMSPDGHGGTITALQTRGMLDDMASRGTEILFYFQVDNPLVEVADPAFIGLHRERGADISVKVCAKRDPAEGLGVVAVSQGRNQIIEYIDLPAEEQEALGPDGRLKFLFGSVAIHVFSYDFLVQEANAALPLHIAHKKVPYCDDDGRTVKPDAPNAFKFEKFVFDVLPDADSVLNLEFAREQEFSPVKNAEGSDSPETCQRDMMTKFAGWLTACGVEVPTGDDGTPSVKLEIDPVFAASAAELADKLTPDFRIDGDTLLS
jgi:UDP-N-acetylglucosamine/UDP-N-acetylgalactosamine diphosphorylase